MAVSEKHTLLCEQGGKWLKKHERNIEIPNCSTIAVDMTTIEFETPDIIGWNSTSSIMIEVKVSRSDFKKDKLKKFRIETEKGVGEYRYYLSPTNLIKENEIPDKWGLLYFNDDGKIDIIKLAEYQPSNLKAERNMLLSLIRRIKK
jgi:hypothetical protein